MTDIDMEQWLACLLFLGAGLMIGAIYFLMLARSLRLFSGSGGTGTVLRLSLGRYALAGAGFWLIAQAGALPLLSALLGFLVARSLAFRMEAGADG